MTIQIEKIHHVAYRCKDAKETVEWYNAYFDAGKTVPHQIVFQ